MKLTKKQIEIVLNKINEPSKVFTIELRKAIDKYLRSEINNPGIVVTVLQTELIFYTLQLLQAGKIKEGTKYEKNPSYIG